MLEAKKKNEIINLKILFNQKEMWKGYYDSWSGLSGQ
jgi:hypothetical protein